MHIFHASTRGLVCGFFPQHLRRIALLFMLWAPSQRSDVRIVGQTEERPPVAPRIEL